MKTVLIATSGMSPAVLTETVWALAHPKRKADAVIPDEIKVITTLSGKQQIVEKLLDSGVWLNLRKVLHVSKSQLRFHADQIRVVHNESGTPLDGLSGIEEHTAFADTIMHELWAYTSQSGTRVISSLAGGYKTMSALMLSTMQLLARPGDRITHVLVGGGLETDKQFFFPRNREEAGLIQLIDIPLIPLRQWFQERLREPPPSYEILVHSSMDAIRLRNSGELKVELSSPKSHELWLKMNDGPHHPLTPSHYAYLSFFVSMCLNGSEEREIGKGVEKWLEKLYQDNDRFHVLYDKSANSDTEKVSRRLSELRKYLKTLGSDGATLAELLPKNGIWKLRISPENLKIGEE